MSTKDVKARRTAPLATPTGLGANATKDLSGALNILLADVFALYIKTKNFHWHMSGSHFRDYHLLLDEQADQIYAIGDDVAERVRKLGGTTIRSIGQIGRLQRVRLVALKQPRRRRRVVLLDQRAAVAGGGVDLQGGIERGRRRRGRAAADLSLDLVEQRPGLQLWIAVARGQLTGAPPAGLGSAEVTGADVQSRPRLPELGFQVVVADLAEHLEGAVARRDSAVPLPALCRHQRMDVPDIRQRLGLALAVGHLDRSRPVAVGETAEVEHARGRRGVHQGARELRR